MTKICNLTIKTSAENLQFFCHGQAKKNGWWTDMTTGQDLDQIVDAAIASKGAL